MAGGGGGGGGGLIFFGIFFKLLIKTVVFILFEALPLVVLGEDSLLMGCVEGDLFTVVDAGSSLIDGF